MVEEYTLATVQEYMLHVRISPLLMLPFYDHLTDASRYADVLQIRDNAEFAVRNLLKDVAKRSGNRLHAKDHLDDGSPIELTVTINEKEGSAVFDFEGTGSEMIGARKQ